MQLAQAREVSAADRKHVVREQALVLGRMPLETMPGGVALTGSTPGVTDMNGGMYLADRRWGSTGGVNYQQEADTISHAMISNPAANGNTPLFDAATNLVVFFPSGGSATFSDPSY